jgi:elongation factor G
VLKLGFPLEKRKTLTFIGHNGSGKSALAEALLVKTGNAEKAGGIMNYDPLEVEKKTTLSNSVATFEFGDFQITVVDTPGFGDFISEVILGVAVGENILAILNASAGIEVQTERTWKIAREQDKPIMVFINQMDKERADYNQTLEDLKKTFDQKMLPLAIPIGSGENFSGLVDLLNNKAYQYASDGSGKATEIPIPDVMKNKIKELYDKTIEDIVETDEALMDAYLSGEEIAPDVLAKTLKKAYISGQIVPVFAGSATINAGTDLLLNWSALLCASANESKPIMTTMVEGGSTVEITPNENEPFLGLIFKAAVDPFIGKQSFIKIFSGKIATGDSFVNATKGSSEKASHIYSIVGKDQKEIAEGIAGDIISIPKLKESAVGDSVSYPGRKLLIPTLSYPEPMLSKSVKPISKQDIDKISNGLGRLSESDPTFVWEHDVETGETVISGLGSVHLDVMIERLKRLFKVEVEVGKPKIAYRETVKELADAEYKHKKQTGGHGQYGHVKIKMSPLPRGTGFEFVQTIFGGSVPYNYIPSVEKGVRSGLKKGVLAGYPVVDVKVDLYDGSYHEVDSSDMAFQIAAVQAFKKAMDMAKPTLLEPIMEVEVHVPDENAGDAMGEITSRRGRPLGMESGSKGFQIVKAKVPFAEMLDFMNKLSSITSGKGYFTMKFSEYSEVPGNIQEKIIAERKKELEEANK